MGHHTGENEQGLRKIIDLTRLLSLFVLMIHLYVTSFYVFDELGLTAPVLNQFLGHVIRFKVFSTPLHAKLSTLALLYISLLGAKGKKNEKINRSTASTYLLIGHVLFLPSFTFVFTEASVLTQAIAEVTLASAGYLEIPPNVTTNFRFNVTI